MMAPPRVLIRGDGVAAACCAHLLARAGASTRVERQGRGRVPAVMLSEQALGLIRDIFDRPDLLADLPRIDRRIVAWGPAADPVALPHRAVVVSEAVLLEALFPRPRPFGGGVDFVIHTASPPSGDQRRFGARRAVAVEVRLKDPADLRAAFIESLGEGWLFLIPNPAGATWLLAVGAAPDVLISRSRLIAPRIELAGEPSGAFETCPRLVSPLSGPGWLACGTAAIAFDPICGDGAAQAVREAVLASAVVTAIAEGGDEEALLSHYDSMLVAAMRRHLQLSADFYRTGGEGPWWTEQLEALVEGHRWCTARLAAAPEPRYLLKDFRLTPREAAA